MGLTPSPTATEADRRAAVVAKWQRFGQQFTSSRLVSEATRLLGSTLVSVQVATAAGATSYWPGGTPSTVTPWMSTIRRILFLVTQPAGMTDVEFYDAVNAANAFMDGEAPADVTWSWYRADAVHGVQGFYLDSTHNLDNSAFDV